ncbi:hypothetical protein [Burkholderia sp. Ac-20365]|uniref:hypothetical protein n=1 Tax=Burkholderia sp. Ac-20365 TaxID=2703897 RepID=UPI00197C95EB|nr:hypothetical protein [Burkholderia sp. Ac-20365]MBN3765266.1 hypothetical protein [Burkholderia sp. Ac-20365]
MANFTCDPLEWCGEEHRRYRQGCERNMIVQRTGIALCVAIVLASNVQAAVNDPDRIGCSVDQDEVSHDLEVKQSNGGIVSFSYLSSVPGQGIATNCTIDSSLVKGTPIVSSNMMTYPMLDGDVITVTKTARGFVFDMSKLDQVKYCSGPIASKILLQPGKKKCVLLP